MMKDKSILFLLLILLFSNCDKENDSSIFPDNVELIFNFEEDGQSWEGDFSDYPKEHGEFYELNFGFSNLPLPLNTNFGSLRQSGNNHSDDLFMFIRKQVSNLEPNRNYLISFEIEFASNVADNQVGVGGSPGEGVHLKAGATNVKPEKILDQFDDYKMNIDKGNQAMGGNDMLVIGDFSNDTDLNEYTLKTLIANNALVVSTNTVGELWLIIGTDSGFEATTTIYYNTINVKLKKQ